MTTSELLRSLPFVRVAEPVRFPPGTGAGQRKAPRRGLRADASVREAGAAGAAGAADGSADAALPLELDEVSATGAFVLTDLLLPVGSAVEVEFALPTRGDGIVAQGRVVRVEERLGRPGMGIHFDRMAPEARASLRAFTLWQ